MNSILDKPISEAEAAAVPDGILIRYLSWIWADPDFRAVLEDRSQFIVEQLRSFSRHGFLMPQERQAICKVLFSGPISLQRRVIHVHQRRSESAEGLETPAA